MFSEVFSHDPPRRLSEPKIMEYEIDVGHRISNILENVTMGNDLEKDRQDGGEMK